MNIRLKLSVMLSAFLVLIAVLAVGTVLIFDKMSDTMSALLPVSERNKLYNELHRNIGEFAETVKNWELTGDPRFQKLYRKELADVNKSFENLNRAISRKEELEEIEREFQRVLTYANQIMQSGEPVGDPKVLSRSRRGVTRG